MLRARRDDRGPDRYLTWKLYLFALGAAVGLTGVGTGRRLIVWIGVAILALGMLLRFRRG